MPKDRKGKALACLGAWLCVQRVLVGLGPPSWGKNWSPSRRMGREARWDLVIPHEPSLVPVPLPWAETLEAGRSDEHAGALQGVAGPLEVVPADAIELADVVPRWVVDAVQVGEPTSIEPPACEEGAGGRVASHGEHPWVFCIGSPPSLCSPPDSIWAHLQRQLSLSASRVLKRVPCSANPLCCPAVPL